MMSPEDRAKRGKRHKPTAETRKLVSDLSALGINNTDIAVMLDINQNTLVSHYGEEIHKGRVKANAKIAQTLYKKAIGGDTACLIFWAKTRMGWREVDRLEITGEDGGPVRAGIIAIPTPYKTVEEWRAAFNLDEPEKIEIEADPSSEDQSE